MFPTEYSVSGWFKWMGSQSGWYMAYRLTMNNKVDNQDASRLGDRDLSVFLHSNQNYYPSTYTYTNANMGGDANRQDAINHMGQTNQWHFLYFGYSR